MPSIMTRRAPGIAFAVARPPEGCTSVVGGAVDDHRGRADRPQAAVRLPEAMIAASWRAAPAGSPPRS